MKIIAAVNRRNFLVEMEEDEIVRAAGFTSTYDPAWKKHNAGEDIKVGTVIDVNAAYHFHSKLEANHKKAKDSAVILRALAEMIDAGLDNLVQPPEEPKTEKPE